jgi:hypothetical protein
MKFIKFRKSSEPLTVDVPMFVSPAYDRITSIVRDIDSLNKRTAFVLLPALRDKDPLTYFKLGGVLSALVVRGWGSVWEGNRKEAGLDGSYSNAMRYRRFYFLMVASGLEWSQVKGIPLGKLVELADVLTAENAEYWAAKAGELTRDQLREAVRRSSSATIGVEDQISKMSAEPLCPTPRTATILQFRRR